MDNLYDYKRFAILYVDDELPALRLFTLAFQDRFRILTAPSAREGLRVFEQHKDEIGVLLTDQQMPGRIRRVVIGKGSPALPARRPHPPDCLLG